MLCARTRADGFHGCRTRVSAGGGRGAAGTGGHHGYHSTNTQVISSHHIHFLRKGLSSLALVFLLFLVPRYAYAAPSLEVDGNFAGYEDGEEYKGYVVVDSPDNYQATLCLIGEWSKLIQITTEQYETLSNPSTGGAFYELSQLWKKLGRNASGTDEYYPHWLALSEDFADGLVTVYGYGRVWAAVCTDDLKQQAKEDFNTILEGGDIGVGSGGESDNSLLVYTGNGAKYNDLDEISVVISEQAMTNIENIMERGSFRRYYISYMQTDGADFRWVWFTNADELEYLYNNGKLIGLKNNTENEVKLNNYGYYFTMENNILTIDSVPNIVYNHFIPSGGTYSMSNICYFTKGGGSGGGSGGSNPEPSPDPWEPPTTPETPTNPTTPTPKDPITPNPPTLPGAPSDPVQPAPPQSPTVGDGGTFTVDLQGILDALDEHCIHIQTCLNSNFSGQNSYLGELFSTYTAAIVDQIYNGDLSKIGAIGDVNNTIAQGFSDIFEYWDDYTEWLDKKLDFKIPESDPYDDEDLLNWLRKIYVRQGIGDVNTRPVDPASNYGGMTKWLGVLYGEITGDVSDTSITALSSSLNALQHTFPFSLPWDIQQILQALDATPATPAASITVPALAGAWNAYSYDIDLHWMDSAMVPIRAFELLAFVLYCLVHTKDVFGYVVGDA